MKKTTETPDDLYHIELKTIDGKKTTLISYKNKALLIVNVASRCGFTDQYAELEALYNEYQDKGLVVLGFPCNQFRQQEPGTNSDIKSFAKSCYRITFPMFAKLNVKGKERSPLYTYLASHIQKKPFFFIPWNFTKVLVDKKGNVIKRFGPWTSFKRIRKEIDKILQ